MDFKEISPAYRRGPTLQRLLVIGTTLGALGLASGLVGLTALDKAISWETPSKVIVFDSEGSTTESSQGSNETKYQGINLGDIFQPKKNPYIVEK